MDLIVTCQKRFNSLWAKITYPYKIAPRRSYKNNFDIDSLHDGNFYIVRRSNLPYSDTFDELGTLKVSALIEHEDLRKLKGLSMNLLGGKFLPNHICFTLKSESSKDWDKAKDSYVIFQYKYIKHIQLNKISTPIFYSLKDLNNIKFPFYKARDKDSERLSTKLNLKIDSSEKQITFSGSSKILHKPNKLNYWHIELHLFNAEGNIIKNFDIKSPSIPSEKSSDIKLRHWHDQLVQCVLFDCLVVKAKSSIDTKQLQLIDSSIIVEKAS